MVVGYYCQSRKILPTTTSVIVVPLLTIQKSCRATDMDDGWLSLDKPLKIVGESPSRTIKGESFLCIDSLGYIITRYVLLLLFKYFVRHYNRERLDRQVLRSTYKKTRSNRHKTIHPRFHCNRAALKLLAFCPHHTLRRPLRTIPSRALSAAQSFLPSGRRDFDGVGN